MRRSRLLILLCAALACVLLLSSCAWGRSYKKLFAKDAYTDSAPTANTAAQVATLSGASFEESRAVLAYLTDTVTSDGHDYTKHIVYNMATNAVVLEVTNTLTANFDITLLTANHTAFFTVRATTWQMVEDVPSHYESKTSLYTATGSLLHEVKGTVHATARLDLIELDGKCYRVADDGSVAEAFTLGDFSNLPMLTDRTERYYYNIDSGDALVTVYDLACSPIASYAVPAYATAMDAFVLEAGDVLVQYAVAEPDDAKDYSFVMQTGALAPTKFTIHTVLLDAKKGDAKEIKFEYYLENLIRSNEKEWVESYGFDDRYDNLAVAYEIVDGRVDTSSTARVALAVSNSGKVKSVLKDIVPAQTTAFPTQIASNRWLVQDNLSRSYLVNEKGKVVGEVTGADDRNNAYYVAGGKLYDFDLNAVYDFESANQEIYSGSAGYGVMRHGILLENNDGEIVCYANGAATAVIAKDSSRVLYTVTDAYFVVRDYSDVSNIKYELYNDVGVKLTTFDYAPDAVAEGEDGVFLISYIQNDGTVIYYRCH